MKKENLFYIITILTILLIRLEFFIFPNNKLIFYGFRIHHFYIGLLLILIVLLIPKVYNKIKLVLFSIGVGLVADELIFIIFNLWAVTSYWSIYSIIGVIVIEAIIFAERKHIIRRI